LHMAKRNPRWAGRLKQLIGDPARAVAPRSRPDLFKKLRRFIPLIGISLSLTGLVDHETTATL